MQVTLVPELEPDEPANPPPPAEPNEGLEAVLLHDASARDQAVHAATTNATRGKARHGSANTSQEYRRWSAALTRTCRSLTHGQTTCSGFAPASRGLPLGASTRDDRIASLPAREGRGTPQRGVVARHAGSAVGVSARVHVPTGRTARARVRRTGLGAAVDADARVKERLRRVTAGQSGARNGNLGPVASAPGSVRQADGARSGEAASPRRAGVRHRVAAHASVGTVRVLRACGPAATRILRRRALARCASHRVLGYPVGAGGGASERGTADARAANAGLKVAKITRRATCATRAPSPARVAGCSIGGRSIGRDASVARARRRDLAVAPPAGNAGQSADRHHRGGGVYASFFHDADSASRCCTRIIARPVPDGPTSPRRISGGVAARAVLRKVAPECATATTRSEGEPSARQVLIGRWPYEWVHAYTPVRLGKQRVSVLVGPSFTS